MSFSCQFLRLARFEPAELEVTTLHSGKRSGALRVDMRQGGRLFFTGTAWVANSGSEAMAHDFTARPDIPAPEDVKSFRELYPDAPPSPFFANFENKPINPRAEGDLTPRDPEIEGLFRFQPRAAHEDPFVDALRVCIVLDTYAWLATYGAHPVQGPSPWIAPTLDYYYRFHRPTAAHEWLYMHNRADVAEDSIVSADGQVFALDGTVLASGATQMFCSPRPQQFK